MGRDVGLGAENAGFWPEMEEFWVEMGAESASDRKRLQNAMEIKQNRCLEEARKSWAGVGGPVWNWVRREARRHHYPLRARIRICICSRSSNTAEPAEGLAAFNRYAHSAGPILNILFHSIFDYQAHRKIIDMVILSRTD